VPLVDRWRIAAWPVALAVVQFADLAFGEKLLQAASQSQGF